MEINLKPVEYFGHRITVPIWVVWLATDADGELYGYKHEPYLPANSVENNWLRVFDPAEKRCFVATVELQGTDWRDTKVKV